MIRRGRYGVVEGTKGLVSATIRLITRSRYSHAYIRVSGTQIVEAAARGAVISAVNKHPADKVAMNATEPLTSDMQTEIALQACKLVGTPYSYLDILALGLAGFGVRSGWLARRIARTDRLICSQLVDEAYRRAGYQLFNDGRLPQDVTPADLADRLTREVWLQ